MSIMRVCMTESCANIVLQALHNSFMTEAAEREAAASRQVEEVRQQLQSAQADMEAAQKARQDADERCAKLQAQLHSKEAEHRVRTDAGTHSPRFVRTSKAA